MKKTDGLWTLPVESLLDHGIRASTNFSELEFSDYSERKNPIIFLIFFNFFFFIYFFFSCHVRLNLFLVLNSLHRVFS